MERTVLLRLFGALANEGVAYVLVGGVAVNLHGVVRATEDVDIFVRPSDDNVARLKAALKATFADDPDIDEIAACDLRGAYPVIRYVPRDGSLTLDVIARLGARFAFDDLEATPRDLDGVLVSLATPRTLHRMKRDTARAIDAQDAARLRSAFDLEDDE
ncbi:hypothetical protein BH23DEI1_BH23DEI1_05380 [soil metagenome]|nr:nucleotidyl transferase AbiEii/AbiGii toxin family protein [Trueperaceae bacterium]